MPKNKIINANTNGFDKNPQNINKKGRKKNIFNILKDKGYSSDDIRTIFVEMLFYNDKELKTVIADKKQPAIMTTVANAIQKSMTKGDFKQIKDILEHVIGKAPQEINQQTKMTITDLTDEQQSEILKKLENEY